MTDNGPGSDVVWWIGKDMKFTLIFHSMMLSLWNPYDFPHPTLIHHHPYAHAADSSQLSSLFK